MLMNTRLILGTIPQEITINPDRITAQGKAESPCLLIPIKIDFTPNRTGNAAPKNPLLCSAFPQICR
jgi:hypothetical protein